MIAWRGDALRLGVSDMWCRYLHIAGDKGKGLEGRIPSLAAFVCSPEATKRTPASVPQRHGALWAQWQCRETWDDRQGADVAVIKRPDPRPDPRSVSALLKYR